MGYIVSLFYKKKKKKRKNSNNFYEIIMERYISIIKKGKSFVSKVA